MGCGLAFGVFLAGSPVKGCVRPLSAPSGEAAAFLFFFWVVRLETIQLLSHTAVQRRLGGEFRGQLPQECLADMMICGFLVSVEGTLGRTLLQPLPPRQV